jgi:hypothetical protein
LELGFVYGGVIDVEGVRVDHALDGGEAKDNWVDDEEAEDDACEEGASRLGRSEEE